MTLTTLDIFIFVHFTFQRNNFHSLVCGFEGSIENLNFFKWYNLYYFRQGPASETNFKS